jgi:hypothetical protein
LSHHRWHGGHIAIAPAQQPVDAAVLSEQRRRIRATVSQPGPSPCTDDGSTEITFGDIRFGSNNEIVKFLVSIGKFSKEMGDRIGHEVSTEKLKEWVADPAGSFARSDPGKAADTVVKTITQPIQNYCDHNWCP